MFNRKKTKEVESQIQKLQSQVIHSTVSSSRMKIRMDHQSRKLQELIIHLGIDYKMDDGMIIFEDIKGVCNEL